MFRWCMYMPEPRLAETQGRAQGWGRHQDTECWLWDSSAWVQMLASCVILTRSPVLLWGYISSYLKRTISSWLGLWLRKGRRETAREYRCFFLGDERVLQPAVVMVALYILVNTL